MRRFLAFIALLPLFYTAFAFMESHDPIKFFYTVSGFSAIVALFLGLVLKSEKALCGLFGLFYASLHVCVFLLLDLLSFGEFASALSQKPFIIVGLLAFLMMIYLFIAKKHYHLAYLIVLLGSIHIYMAQKIPSVLEGGLIALSFLLLYLKMRKKRLAKV